MAPIIIAPATDAEYELRIINGHRAEFGLGPLSLNSEQSVSSVAHSQAMAQSGTIWHVNPTYPSQSFPNNFVVSGWRTIGENVGMAGGYGVRGGIDIIERQMWTEPHTAGCTGNHACDEIGQSFNSVGIGIFVNAQGVWLTADFVG
ncbi:MAG: hypothetical protein NVSMB52_03560 [Chloroflexota bacterium]